MQHYLTYALYGEDSKRNPITEMEQIEIKQEFLFIFFVKHLWALIRNGEKMKKILFSTSLMALSKTEKPKFDY